MLVVTSFWSNMLLSEDFSVSAASSLALEHLASLEGGALEKVKEHQAQPAAGLVNGSRHRLGLPGPPFPPSTSGVDVFLASGGRGRMTNLKEVVALSGNYAWSSGMNNAFQRISCSGRSRVPPPAVWNLRSQEGPRRRPHSQDRTWVCGVHPQA